MAGYQADTFQCIPLIYVWQIVRCYAASKKQWATYFFISCAKCLWDAVRHFLGSLARAQDAGITRLCSVPPVVGMRVAPEHFK
ncbi:hypothetical protein EMIT0P253_10041 [Pseudomonas sp. IT-P253]|jgi:hypothetical protein